MPRIRQLPHDVVARIAAGEVIERPASVVKELLENSVDAGSRRIDVEIDQGGVELIRVVDDGCGISAEDLPLAFASHATSKLVNADDLFQIASLGFRGEALASVGGVGQVRLQSRPTDEPTGAEITCNGGELAPIRAWNGSPGTRVEVKHLFYNTPVRKKFLKGTATEMGHVAEVFTRIALAHPDLHLTLRHNGKHVYEVAGTKNTSERIGLFFGADLRPKLFDLEATQGPYSIRGFAADPSCDRGTPKLQYLFLNGRHVRDRSLGHAVQEAYRGLLMTGRYAIAFLFLEVPPDLVDVNVHPTKAEVRFRDPSALHHLVYSTLRSRLNRENLTARLQTPSYLPTFPPPEPRGMAPKPGTQTRPAFELFPSPTAAPSLPYTAPTKKTTEQTADRPVDNRPLPEDPIPPAKTETKSGAVELLLPPDDFKAIQLYDAYLVLETPEGMLVIDQHALHERVLFEQYKERVRTGPLEAQRLLIPEPINLPPDLAARALEAHAALGELGFGVEDFGGGTVLVTSYPALLGQRSPGLFFRTLVDTFLSQDELPSREVLFHDVLSLMACHSAVRSGDRLSAEEMALLVTMRHLADDTHHCPHGRPTALLFSRHELEKQFRRV